MEQVLASLNNLEVLHSVLFLNSEKDSSCIDSLLKAGNRILTGEHKPAKWDYFVSLILLKIKHYDAADALGELADIAIQESCLDSSLSVLSGFWDSSLWDRRFWRALGLEKTELPGVFNFFNEESALKTHINLCKFIAVVTSERCFSTLDQQEKVRNVFFDFKSFLHTRSDLPFKILIERIEYLVQHGDNSLKEYAIQASTNLLWCVSQLKNLDNSPSKQLTKKKRHKSEALP